METKSISELEERTHRAEDDFKQNLHSLEDHVAEKVEEVKTKVEDVKHQAKEVVTDVKDFVSSLNPATQTEKHPLAGVAVATVVGGLVGYRLGGPATRRVVRQVAEDVKSVPHYVASEGPSLVQQISRGIIASGLLASPLATAAGERLADWGRKKYPNLGWVIDALEQTVGGDKSTRPVSSSPPEYRAETVPETKSEDPDILH